MISITAKVLIPAATAFLVGIAFAPFLAALLYHKRAWKKHAGKEGMGGGGTPIFNELHKEREVSTPRMGGILIWASVLATAGLFFLLARTLDTFWLSLDFVHRRETWLPLFALAAGALAGLVDDLLEIRESMRGGLSLARRLAIVGTIGCIAGWWFYAKLGVESVGIPFSAPLSLGILVVPFFALVTIAIYAGGTIDGIDGLAGGVFAIIFLVYAGIAFGEGQASLAAFAASVAGATLAFLWFNIPPARFYMSETGSMALTLALAMVAFASDTLAGGVGVFVLPIVAVVLTATVLTTLAQVFSKKVFGRKLFLVAPIHHHFEALGWPAAKVTMRYWVITIIAGVLGLALALLARMP